VSKLLCLCDAGLGVAAFGRLMSANVMLSQLWKVLLGFRRCHNW